jgi:hypothetical protein
MEEAFCERALSFSLDNGCTAPRFRNGLKVKRLFCILTGSCSFLASDNATDNSGNGD